MVPDPWENLKSLTAARIALGRSGGSLPTRELLDFSLAHARARDAVLAPFDAERLAKEIAMLGTETLVVESAAGSRDLYLQRPDRGRTLCDKSRDHLQRHATDPVDMAIVVSDGLSSLAAERQVVPLLGELLPRLRHDGWRLAPVVVVRFGRVAIQDEIGAALNATISLILLGERPGLGSPDSLGAYLVYDPQRGRTDAQRNCVSNIRPEGLPPAEAASTLHYLLTEARRRKLSGVALKDERVAIGSDVRSVVGNLPAPASDVDCGTDAV